MWNGWWAYSKPIKALLDWSIWLLAFPIAFYLRLDQPAGAWVQAFGLMTALAAPITLAAIAGFALYRQSWAHTGMRDAERLAWAVGTGTMALFAMVAVGNRFYASGIPRSVPLIAGTLALVLMGGTRLSIRTYFEGRPKGDRGVIIMGTDQTAILYARNVRERDPGAIVLGFIDDNPARQGVSYVGSPVLGKSKAAEAILDRYDCDEVVISGAPGHRASRLVEDACHSRGIRCRYLADPAELLYGRLQRADAEGLRDLLPRKVTNLDADGIRATIAGKKVMITGAGGSIGSEMARQVASLAPSQLLLLSHDENSLFELEADLATTHPGLPVKSLVADIKHRPRLRAVMGEHQPQIVFHAAAHKHVPLMEEHPCEAVLNNVQGTRNLLSLAVEHGVERFVNISTDKAVRPTNIMGATKHVGELLVREFAEAAPGQFVSVRFGNVLGSRGSVVPTWTKQIEDGGPVTLTDERMTRYFMLIPEAVELVLEAAYLGGRGTTYVLDMGEPVKIRNLAEQLIRLHGYVPDKDIHIVVTGLRPGEKLYEELVVETSELANSPHPLLLVEGHTQVPDDLLSRIDALQEAAENNDEHGVRAQLEALVVGSHLKAQGGTESH